MERRQFVGPNADLARVGVCRSNASKNPFPVDGNDGRAPVQVQGCGILYDVSRLSNTTDLHEAEALRMTLSPTSRDHA